MLDFSVSDLYVVIAHALKSKSSRSPWPPACHHRISGVPIMPRKGLVVLSQWLMLALTTYTARLGDYLNDTFRALAREHRRHLGLINVVNCNATPPTPDAEGAMLFIPDPDCVHGVHAHHFLHGQTCNITP